MRSASQCPDSPADRYRTAIEMAAWADRNPVDLVGLSEHHLTDDGFLSAPLQLAPLCGGLPLEFAWRSLSLFEQQLKPELE